MEINLCVKELDGTCHQHLKYCCICNPLKGARNEKKDSD